MHVLVTCGLKTQGRAFYYHGALELPCSGDHRFMRISRTVVLVGLALTAAGCTWVESRPGAERILIAEPGQVADCTHQGTTRASVRDRVMAVQRKPGKVAEEIETLARTSAMEMGGDTLVPIGPVRDGAREFIVYKCR